MTDAKLLPPPTQCPANTHQPRPSTPVAVTLADYSTTHATLAFGQYCCCGTPLLLICRSTLTFRSFPVSLFLRSVNCLLCAALRPASTCCCRHQITAVPGLSSLHLCLDHSGVASIVLLSSIVNPRRCSEVQRHRRAQGLALGPQSGPEVSSCQQEQLWSHSARAAIARRAEDS
ncbi:uncharacterized protein PSFLO_00396 [Pseudozyma flocculosa]|uniref:Uncharacterized protein n=1 Tax=Pseudozyma flocculosa TaxID=84751 RepID=A0A5C3ETC8_9BASI|nr:uncharacterized protein PSFLO_00396 [Pseudozyma flocculosa]